jgi:hypothetical protein
MDEFLAKLEAQLQAQKQRNDADYRLRKARAELASLEARIPLELTVAEAELAAAKARLALAEQAAKMPLIQKESGLLPIPRPNSSPARPVTAEVTPVLTLDEAREAERRAIERVERLRINGPADLERARKTVEKVEIELAAAEFDLRQLSR